METKRVEARIGRHTLSIETGRMAKQANGSVLVRYADTVVLVTACASEGPVDLGYFPLRVDYREMTYAAGKIPGGFFKREGRPTTKEVLTCRLMDRPIRPLFPSGFMNEVQVIGVVLSADRANDPDILSVVGGSAALLLAPDIPFFGPIGAVRVGRVDGNLILNPTHSERVLSDFDIVVAGTDQAVCMIEGDAREVNNDEVMEAVLFGHRAIKDLTRVQRELADAVGAPSRAEAAAEEPNPALPVIEAEYFDRIAAATRGGDKFTRRNALKAIAEEAFARYGAEQTPDGLPESQVKAALEACEKKATRDRILNEGVRSDGRRPEEIRPITCEVGVLPRAHGSALFTRGETQALVACTLGTVSDEQRVDGLEEEYTKKFMLHYNFPPFCVGEVKFLRAPSRREQGHGNLAERSLQSILPPAEEFPYTLRLVSDILESNGSSSMASVCGGTLALMDAGVPIRRPVAGIAMGMVVSEGRTAILSDIQGEEDHYGDMDLKVAGTQRGITGIQMDLKTHGITEHDLAQALEQAREGRLQILRTMLQALDRPRDTISKYAPRLIRIKINPEKIGTVIGPGGKVVRALQEETDSNIEIDDDGTVTISSLSADGAERARQKIEAMTEEVQVGKVYEGTVTTIKDFGAFVEILPNQDGLVHISELSDSYVRDIHSLCKVGDRMLVKVIDIDGQGRIRLSRKAALKEKE